MLRAYTLLRLLFLLTTRPQMTRMRGSQGIPPAPEYRGFFNSGKQQAIGKARPPGRKTPSTQRGTALAHAHSNKSRHQGRSRRRLE